MDNKRFVCWSDWGEVFLGEMVAFEAPNEGEAARAYAGAILDSSDLDEKMTITVMVLPADDFERLADALPENDGLLQRACEGAAKEIKLGAVIAAFDWAVL